VDAILLAGGSGFGLDAAGGAQAFLREAGRGFQVGAIRVPIVPQAIVFDLLNGGNKNWRRFSPYRELGYEACAVAGCDVMLGSAGAGLGATTANLKGGIGSTSCITAHGYRIGALVVVNAIGSATIGDGPHFWAAPWEREREFGGLGMPEHLTAQELEAARKGHARSTEPGTTIALVATDARLNKAQAKRMAMMADDGLARALRFAHAPMDGDTVFAAATARKPLFDPDHLTEIGIAAGDCLARAIARAVYQATALPFADALPAWRDRFGMFSK
jgi:L-aminopeptidase/D-esterase-like protein